MVEDLSRLLAKTWCHGVEGEVRPGFFDEGGLVAGNRRRETNHKMFQVRARRSFGAAGYQGRNPSEKFFEATALLLFPSLHGN